MRLLENIDFGLPLRKSLRIKKARDCQNTTGTPDDADCDASRALTHPWSQRINDGDIAVIGNKIKENQNSM